ncbi:MAG: hypothetical protein HOP96_06030 [Sphingomonas sp.]|nr:hypothetical protein [Sphingomonas sp.]
MIRLLLGIVCALGLALAPFRVAHASAPSGMKMSNCAAQMQMAAKDMAGMHGKSGHHKSMNCCSPACQTPAPSAIASACPSGNGVLDTSKASFPVGPLKHLLSATGSGLDPPPRA